MVATSLLGEDREQEPCYTPQGRGSGGEVMVTLDGQLRKAHLGLSLTMCRMRRLGQLSSEYSSHTTLV